VSRDLASAQGFLAAVVCGVISVNEVTMQKISAETISGRAVLET
jgi:hypothetical protein